MQVLSKNHSSYPRIGEKPEQQKLRRAFHQLDKEKITPDKFESIMEQTVTEVIEEQLQCGCDYITDGQIRAYDPISHIAAKIGGFETGGLLRYFDTNFYFRQPRLASPPKYSRLLIKDEFEFCHSIAGAKTTVSLIGPYSLLKLSICENDFGKNLQALASIYARELEDLKIAGASLVQIDEPAILQYPNDFDLLKTALETMTKSPNRPEVLLSSYFGNAISLVERFAELPIDGILFDFTYSPGLYDALTGFPKYLGLGLIDGRNTKMENLDNLRTRTEKLLATLSLQKAYITTSCGLEFLPRDRAFDKLRLCAQLATALNGGTK
jgi:5-methyltetrahydropteroyltriglutamate--homocysteine methyltransferase